MVALRLPGAMTFGVRRAARGFRAWQLWAIRPSLRVYVVSVTSAALVAAPLAATRTDWRARDVAVYLALLVCGVVAIETTRVVSEAQGTVIRDLQTVWYLAIAVTLPPAYALLAPFPLTGYRLWRMRRGFVYRRVFSNATISLAYGSAAWLFHAVPSSAAGPAPGAGTHVLTWAGVVVACGVLAWAVNNGLLLGAIRLADSDARMRDLFGNREASTSDLIELSLAVLLALVVSINPVLMALALPSVLLYRRYLMSAQLVAQARIDPKTGLLNAGTWRREAEVEFARALRGGDRIPLVIVHIDHFQSVPDTAGHPAGDQVLRAVASTITENLRGHDLIGRFGREEFAVLLPRTSAAEVRRITERLRDHIAGQPIAIEDGNRTGFVFRMTVSIGIATVDQFRQSLADLIGAADAALTEAKSTGHNKICVMPGSSTAQTSGN
jgi:diguanylate cyclase (GGDEF)-like protein